MMAYYWQGDEETATVYTPEGNVLCIVCKRHSEDESAATRARLIVLSVNKFKSCRNETP